MITTLIRETVAESRRRLAILAPTSPDHIRRASNAIIALPEETARDVETLRGYLFEQVYRHPRVGRVMAEAEKIVRALFSRYADPAASDTLPERWRQVRDRLDERGQARLAADYLAGQTDRFALAEYARLFDATPELR
jgi:dGTPase